MLEDKVIETQLEFYRSGKSGCLFAAYAANKPETFGWSLSVSDVTESSVSDIINRAISCPDITMQSIIFPSVLHINELLDLLTLLEGVSGCFLEQRVIFKDSICLGYRVRVNDKVSWVTGFGNFSFFPKTRQSVFTEIVFRSKPRPKYETVMKPSPDSVLHLADLNVMSMSENKFKSLWYGSFDKTASILGHNPDLRSAAKTTFSIPRNVAR